MSTDRRAALRSWLDVSAVRTASDIALGVIGLVIGTAVIAGTDGAPFSGLHRLNQWFFPAVVGGVLLVVGAILVVRGGFLSYGQPIRWNPRELIFATLIIFATYGAILLVVLGLPRVALLFGPAEYVAVVVLVLTIAVALGRMSRLRAVAMALLGLLLATVGSDPETGVARLTMGVQELNDGLFPEAVLLGLIVIADGAVCLVSPTTFAAIYARQVAGWISPRIPPITSLGMRIVAALAIAAAFFYAFTLDATAWEYGELLAFGLFGIACKVFGWNRLVLIVAFIYGALLEEQMRRAMLISRGDLTAVLGRPLSGILLLVAGSIVAAVALSWTRRLLFRSGSAC